MPRCSRFNRGTPAAAGPGSVAPTRRAAAGPGCSAGSHWATERLQRALRQAWPGPELLTV
eukprot:239823-Hanusia_phi.AAC.1